MGQLQGQHGSLLELTDQKNQTGLRCPLGGLSPLGQRNELAARAGVCRPLWRLEEATSPPPPGLAKYNSCVVFNHKVEKESDRRYEGKGRRSTSL